MKALAHSRYAFATGAGTVRLAGGRDVQTRFANGKKKMRDCCGEGAHKTEMSEA